MQRVCTLELKHFRSFTHQVFNLDMPVVLIEGNNGAGKTSLAEALHYACYHKSFRTSRSAELVQFNAPGFVMKVHFTAPSLCEELHIGFAGNKKLVKINQRSITTLKEVLAHYRVVTLTEDDLNIIKEGPEWRRTFIDHFIILEDPSFLSLLREYKKILEQRNALVQHPQASYELYEVWSAQLWEKTVAIQERRIQKLMMLERRVQALQEQWMPAMPRVRFIYEPKNQETPLWERLFSIECRAKRSLVGAHLDDLSIMYGEYHAREFASRGQQKLLTLLIRTAQIQELVGINHEQVANQVTLFILDDFITDLDYERLQLLSPLLVSLGVQLIITTPLVESPLRTFFSPDITQLISLA